MGAFKQLKQKRLSSPPETTTNPQEDSHHEHNNISGMKDGLGNYEDDCHNSNNHDDILDREYEIIREEHKRIALKFQQELEER